MNTQQPLLTVSNLSVEFATHGGSVQAVRGVDFQVDRGQTLAIVGESGCGKSVSMQSIMGLIPAPQIPTGTALLQGQSILKLSEKQSRSIRGARISMIFQDAMSAMNPTMTIGDQIAEPLRVHKNLSRKMALNRATELLERCQIPEAAQRARQYPFEFSGGMLQRAMIAMALACSPEVLIADEPTTALDVSIQADILQLLKSLQQEQGMAIILITHDLGVVAQMADNVSVMYAGQVVENGSVDDIFYRPAHPYTVGLHAAMPVFNASRTHRLQAIPGSPPDLFSPPAGCGYAPRCPYAMIECQQNNPPAFVLNAQSQHQSKCWLQHPKAPATSAPIFQS